MQDWFASWLYLNTETGERREGWNIFTVPSDKPAKAVAVEYLRETAQEQRIPLEKLVLNAFNRV